MFALLGLPSYTPVSAKGIIYHGGHCPFSLGPKMAHRARLLPAHKQTDRRKSNKQFFVTVCYWIEVGMVYDVVLLWQ